MKLKCKRCGQIFYSEEEATDLYNQCRLEQEQSEMDDFASNIIFSPFNPGI